MVILLCVVVFGMDIALGVALLLEAMSISRARKMNRLHGNVYGSMEDFGG